MLCHLISEELFDGFESEFTLDVFGCMVRPSFLCSI